MNLCFPYRYLIVGMTSIGLTIVTSYKAVFIFVLTHTTKKNISDLSDTTFYTGCTSYNSSTDYISDYSQDTGMQFHALYYFSMSLAMAASGLIAGRFKSNRIMAFGVFTSTVLFLVLPTVFKVSRTGVLVIRFVQGFLEAMVQPALIALVSSWAKRKERSMFLSIAFLGMHLSPVITSVAVGSCLCYVSWDSAIYIYGILGVIWTLVWIKVSYPLPQECPGIKTEELEDLAKDCENLMTGSRALVKKIPWKSILLSKAVWAIWLACFCRNFISSIIQAIQPLFFLDVFGIRAADSGILQTIPFGLNSLFVFFFSYVADRLIASRRFSITVVRKLMQCTGVFIEAFFLGFMTYATTWQMSFIFMTTAFTFGGVTFAGYTCNMMDLSPQYSGVVSAVTITGVVGGAASPFIASLIPDDPNGDKNWNIIFWLAAVVAALSGVVYFLFASGERQEWSEERVPCKDFFIEVETASKESNEKTSLLSAIVKTDNVKGKIRSTGNSSS